MIDKEFCELLEYRISESLSNSENIDVRRCWCDGVYEPEKQDYSLEQNCLVIKGWIDEGREKGKENGQFEYKFIIRLGEKAIKIYKKGFSLKECIPESVNDNWISLDLKQRKIEVQLD